MFEFGAQHRSGGLRSRRRRRGGPVVEVVERQPLESLDLECEARPLRERVQVVAPTFLDPVGIEEAVGRDRLVCVVGCRVEEIDRGGGRRRGCVEPVRCGPDSGGARTPSAVDEAVHGVEIPAAGRPDVGVDQAAGGVLPPPHPPGTDVVFEPSDLHDRRRHRPRGGATTFADHRCADIWVERERDALARGEHVGHRVLTRRCLPSRSSRSTGPRPTSDRRPRQLQADRGGPSPGIHRSHHSCVVGCHGRPQSSPRTRPPVRPAYPPATGSCRRPSGLRRPR